MSVRVRRGLPAPPRLKGHRLRRRQYNRRLRRGRLLRSCDEHRWRRAGRLTEASVVCRNCTDRLPSGVNQLLDRHFAEVDPEYNTTTDTSATQQKHILPLLGEQKVVSLDAGVMDSFYAELQRERPIAS
ncbi:hypothetical protein GCM10028799_09450 [Kribbella italica]